MRFLQSCKLSAVVGLMVAAGALGGCETNRGTGALVGAGAGAALGAVIGHQSGHAMEGALIGGAAGGAGGYIIGNETDKRNRR